MTRLDAARLIAINLVASLAVATGVSWWMQGHHKPAFGTLDITELYRLKESQVAAVLIQRDSGDADRLLAIQQAAAFGAQVSKVLETLPQDCGCLVVAPGALLGTSTQIVDLTPQVRRQLGLEARP